MEGLGLGLRLGVLGSRSRATGTDAAHAATI